MLQYEFDVPVERRGTDCEKWDTAKAWGKSDDLLPLWVADMDFRVPETAVSALKERIDHGVFGYTVPGTGYRQAVVNWMGRYGWHPDPEWIVSTPGVVFALATAVRAFTQPGDAVLIQRPVYYPFSGVIEGNGRKLVNAPLTEQDGHYTIDFAAFERAIVDQQVKLFLLCNPHNPVGRAWTREELEQLAEICLRHGVLVVSDEIHMDFARPGYTHTIFATLSDAIRDRCVVCTAASKSFNLAGLAASGIFIPNEDLRKRFRTQMLAMGVEGPNIMGLVATQAVYEQGGPWLEQLKAYLEGNWTTLADVLAEHAPELKLIPAESTYLAWVDCRALGLYGKELQAFIEDKAKLWLDLGDLFGPEGDGFIRLNLATQKSTVLRAANQLADALIVWRCLNKR